MAIKGSLKEASLPDVIQLLFLGRRTGCLALADRHNFGTIYFEEGHIVYAAIVNRRDRLGDILVRSGRITAGAARSRRSRAQEGDREHKLGEILVELGALPRAGARELHPAPDRGGGVLPVHLDLGDVQLRGRRPAGAGGLPRPDQPRVPAARGRAAGGRVEPDREEDSLVRPDLLGGPGPHRRVGARRSRPSSSGCVPLLDGTARRAGGHRRVGPGGVRGREGAVRADHRRASPTGSAPRRRPRPKVNDGRVEEHRNLGIAFYKAAMLDEALREFRRVADLRPDRRQRAVLPRAHRRCARRRWEEAAAAFKQAAGGAGGPARGAAQPRATPSSGSGRLDEAEAAYGDAAGRARDDARIMLGWSVVALKRGEHQVAQGRLARALELLGGKPRARALVLGRHARRARGSTTRRARSGPPGRASAAYPGQRGAAEQSRRAARADAATWPAPRRRSGPRWPRTRRCRRSPRTWPTSSTGTAATRRRARPTSAPPSWRPIWATTCTSSWATSPTSGATSRSRARAGAGPPTLNPGARAGPGQPRDAGHGAVTADDAAFAALVAPDHRDERLRARGLQGQVHPAPDRGADARLRRAHLRGLPRAARPVARRVRAAAGRAHHQRHPLLPERRDLEPAPARRAAGAARPPPGRGPGLERGVRLGRGAVHARRAGGRPPRPRRPGRRAGPAHHRRDRHRPRQPRAGPGGVLSERGAHRDAATIWPSATSSRRARAPRDRPRPPAGAASGRST